MIIELAKRRRTVREFRRDNFPVEKIVKAIEVARDCLLYTSPSPRDS